MAPRTLWFGRQAPASTHAAETVERSSERYPRNAHRLIPPIFRAAAEKLDRGGKVRRIRSGAG